MSDEFKPNPQLALRNDIALVWEESVMAQLEPYFAELAKEPADEFNSLIVDLLDSTIDMHNVQLPNGQKYSKAPSGYIIALNIWLDKFMKAQSQLHNARGGSVIENILARRAAGEDIGQWITNAPTLSS